MATRAPRSAVEAALDQRRIDLRMTWQDIASQARISNETLRKIRIHGTTGVDPVNIAAVEDALRVERGSITSVERGGALAPLAEPEPDPDGVSLVEAPGGGQAWQLRRVIAGRVILTTISATPDVSREWAAEELHRIADRLEWEMARREKRL